MQNRGEAAGATLSHTRAETRSPHKNAIQKYDFHLRFVHTFSFSHVARVNLTAGFTFLGPDFGIRPVRVLGALYHSF